MDHLIDDNDRLKPCPFCGGKATFDHDDNGWNWIECLACGASTNVRVNTMDDCKPLLLEQWNKRVPPACACREGECESKPAGFHGAQPTPSAPKDELPDRDPDLPAEQQGLFRKFVVHRTDGSSTPGGKHYGCRYFVLDVDHDKHAAAALTAYAADCETTHPELAKDLREKWGAQPATSVPREAIDKMLTQLMDIAVSNGANSVSMPDEYVEVAAWLCGIPAQPAPSIHEVTDAMALAFHAALTDGSVGEHEMEEIKAGLRAALAAAPEAKL